jgi:hypothetical protein
MGSKKDENEAPKGLLGKIFGSKGKSERTPEEEAKRRRRTLGSMGL